MKTLGIVESDERGCFLIFGFLDFLFLFFRLLFLFFLVFIFYFSLLRTKLARSGGGDAARKKKRVQKTMRWRAVGAMVALPRCHGNTTR